MHPLSSCEAFDSCERAALTTAAFVFMKGGSQASARDPVLKAKAPARTTVSLSAPRPHCLMSDAKESPVATPAGYPESTSDLAAKVSAAATYRLTRSANTPPVLPPRYSKR